MKLVTKIAIILTFCVILKVHANFIGGVGIRMPGDALFNVQNHRAGTFFPARNYTYSFQYDSKGTVNITSCRIYNNGTRTSNTAIILQRGGPRLTFVNVTVTLANVTVVNSWMETYGFRLR